MNNNNNKLQQYEELKVFVGNLPLGTLDTEVEVFLRNLVDISLQINEIFLLFNKKNLGPEPTVSAIVTFGSKVHRDCVMDTFAEKYMNCRYQFKNKNLRVSKIYISLCHPKRNNKNETNLSKNTNGKEAIQRSVVLKKQQTPANDDYQNKELDISNADNDTDREAQVNKEINDLEHALKERCPELYVSSKELVLLQKECEDLSHLLDIRKKDLVSKCNEYNDVCELFEQLNC